MQWQDGISIIVNFIIMEQYKETGFKELLNSLMQKRWYVTATILGIFVFILVGLFATIIFGVEASSGTKEILLLLLGVLSGSFNKIVDYYYSNDDKDVMLTNKMDEENDTPEILAAKLKLKEREEND